MVLNIYLICSLFVANMSAEEECYPITAGINPNSRTMKNEESGKIPQWNESISGVHFTLCEPMLIHTFTLINISDSLAFCLSVFKCFARVF